MSRSRETRPDRARRADLEVIAESIPHIVWLAAADGSTDYFNGRGSEYTGFAREANYGWRWVELVHPDDAEGARLGWEHATRTVTPFVLSYRIRRHDGGFRWHAFRALPVRGPGGEILRWIGTADDVDGPVPEDEAVRVERQSSELRDLLDAVQPVDRERFGFVEPSVRAARVNRLLAIDDGTTAVSVDAGPEGDERSSAARPTRTSRAGRVAAGGRRIHQRRDRQPPRLVVAQRGVQPGGPSPDPGCAYPRRARPLRPRRRAGCVVPARAAGRRARTRAASVRCSDSPTWGR